MHAKRLTDRFFVAAQLHPGDMLRARALGFDLIVNNRPDHEGPEQPSAAQIESAAHAAGLHALHIPVTASGIDSAHVAAFAHALEQGHSKVLAFCRTGTRSTMLWALSQAGVLPAAEICEVADRAGYDVSALVARSGN